MEGQRQGLEDILSDEFVVFLHVVEKSFFVADVEVLLEVVVD